MKINNLTLTFLFIISTFMQCFAFKGSVRFAETQFTIAHATVSIYKQAHLIASIQTDVFGEFEIKLPKGEYNIYIIAEGAEKLSQKIVIHSRDYMIFLLKGNLIEKNKPYFTKGKKVMVSKGEAHAEKASSAVRATYPSSISTSRFAMDEMMTPPADFHDTKSPSPKAGLLTAGEINDFQKWNYWEDLSEHELKSFKTSWHINPHLRYTVQLTNSLNNPVVDALVVLRDAKNNSIWETHTDNTGKAELWGDLFNDSINTKAQNIEVTYDEKKYLMEDPKIISKGINFKQLPVDCNSSNAVDIAFVVDATGSMGDEIQYLKEEMQDVIKSVQSKNQQLVIHTGAVFYKDFGDEYLTKISNFSKEIITTQNFIKEQNAGGGGDFPEAVDEALAVAIRDLNWNVTARTRILFLVLDAPPHQETNIITRTQKLMMEAAKKGIRIIPISSSGIDKSTEYLMRCFALATNGSYAFLTNHSGIGDAHLAPSTDTFKVELINDLLVRLIQQFTYIPTCKYAAKKDTLAITEENPFNMYHVTYNLKIFPNPTSDRCVVEIPDSAEEVILTDLSGKLLDRMDTKNKTSIELSLMQYPVGIYFVRCLRKEKWMTEKLIVSR